MKNKPKIAVIGDIIYDEYITCDILGISPEDEIAPKLKKINTRYTPGGAANVAANLQSLGAHTDLYGVVGNDTHGEYLKKLFPTIYIDNSRPTTTKKRIMTSKGRHIIRLDEEETNNIKDSIAESIIKCIEQRKYDKIIISDYAKGVVTNKLLENLQPGYIVDPKRRDLRDYKGAFAITPNKLEFDRCYHDKKQLIIVTLSGDGALMKIGDTETRFYSNTRQFGDPTGCGDSFIAGLTYSLAIGNTIAEAIRIANAAGACVMDHLGVYSVTLEDIQKELSFIIQK